MFRYLVMKMNATELAKMIAVARGFCHWKMSADVHEFSRSKPILTVKRV